MDTNFIMTILGWIVAAVFLVLSVLAYRHSTKMKEQLAKVQTLITEAMVDKKFSVVEIETLKDKKLWVVPVDLDPEVVLAQMISMWDFYWKVAEKDPAQEKKVEEMKDKIIKGATTWWEE